MKTNKSCYLLALLPMALLACGKTVADPAKEAETIRFAEPAQTRAGVDFSSVLDIRDWYDAGTYGVGDATAADPYYINNTLEYDGSSWGYGTAASYPWTQGDHLFFGWLREDNQSTTADFFGPNDEDANTPDDVSLSAATLTIPTTLVNSQSKSFDFIYSIPVRRSTADGDLSPVKFMFKHLFARVAIGFKVTGDDKIKLNRVYLAPFKNKRGATIDFAGNNGAVVAYTDPGDATNDFIARETFNLQNYTKNSAEIDILSQTQAATRSLYYIWPVANGDLPTIEVYYQVYSSASATSPDNVEKHATISFPDDTSWEAGNQYSYTVAYMGGLLELVGGVQDWIQTPTDMTTSSANPQLKIQDQPLLASWGGWDGTTCTVGGIDRLEATYDAPNPVKGRFRIYSPEAENTGETCTYTVSLEDNTRFTFTDAQGTPFTGDATGTIGKTGADYKPGEEIDFFVKPTSSVTTGATTTLTFKVTVEWTESNETKRRTYSLDSEIQKDGPLKVKYPN
jgi:hypothetical protein